MLYASASRAFDQSDFQTCLTDLFRAMHARYDLERPAVQRLIRRKLGVITKQQAEIERLKSKLIEQQKREQERDKALKRYADEYVQMGDECQQHQMFEAAMRNYDKAVALYPGHKQAWSKIRKLEKMLRQKD